MEQLLQKFLRLGFRLKLILKKFPYSFFFEKQSYIVGKWVNGFFTNFKSLKNSLDILEKVREKVHVLRYSSEKKFFKKFEGLKNIFLPFFS